MSLHGDTKQPFLKDLNDSTAQLPLEVGMHQSVALPYPELSPVDFNSVTHLVPAGFEDYGDIQN